MKPRQLLLCNSLLNAASSLNVAKSRERLTLIKSFTCFGDFSVVLFSRNLLKQVSLQALSDIVALLS